MSSPFFKEIPPGPIGPRPTDDGAPAWFKAAWVIGVALVFAAVGGGFYLLSGPDIKVDPVQFQPAEPLKTEEAKPQPESPMIVSSANLNRARTEAATIVPPDSVAVDAAAPADGPWVDIHFRGLGHMERYEYDQAVEAFREVVALQPEWNGAKINLAIARLNQTGTEAEAAKEERTGGGEAKSNFDEALELLDGVIERDPTNLHAHFSRGIILEYVGRIAEAHRDFRIVAVKDPGDGHAWYKVGSTLTSQIDPNQPAGPEEAPELIELFERALSCNPYLVPALYRLQLAYAMAGKRAEQRATIERWTKLNSKQNAAAYGETAETFYGEMGKYARIINPPYRREQKVEGEGAAELPAPPKFAELRKLDVKLENGCRWAPEDDLSNPATVNIQAVRRRFGQAVAAADFDNDGKLDFYVCSAVVTPAGLRDCLLINLGEGRFEDRSSAWGVPADHPSTGVAVADFDADRRVDLFLTGLREHRLLRSLGDWFDDVSYLIGVPGIPALGLTARWLDLDQDGDLDLYVIQYSHANNDRLFRTTEPVGQTNLIFRNDGVPPPVPGRPADNWAPLAVAPADLPAKSGLSLAFAPWPKSETMGGDDAPHTGIAAGDFDDDRDLDVILVHDNVLPKILFNDRQGKFTPMNLGVTAALIDPRITGVLTTDVNQDGRSDLVLHGLSGKVAVLVNRIKVRVGEGPVLEFGSMPIDPRIYTQVITADLDLDGRMELIGLPRDQSIPLPMWSRIAGDKFVTQEFPAVVGTGNATSSVGMSITDVMGSPLPDLVLWTETGPFVAVNETSDRPFIALNLGGRWKRSFDHMRTNPHGLGAKIALEGQGLFVPYEHTTPSAELGQSQTPVVLGTAGAQTVPLLRMRWPDGVMQSELNVPANQLLAMAENNRKTGSCPVLFTWNGERFVCLGDFLGGGGLGYLVAPEVYSQPDRDEALLIDSGQLKAENGVFRMSITEPMDEVAYIDHLMLDVVDHPADVSVGLDERFSPGGNRPTGALRAWKRRIDPLAAQDLKGNDLTDTLKKFDRRTSDAFLRRIGWVGYAEEHAVILDFGDRLKGLKRDEKIILGLAGWVEYPYSQTNFAAATSGVALKPPVLEIEEADGSWKTLEADPGYPAGLPRLTTLELTGRLPLERPVKLRIRTNMECYYDEAFLAVLEPQPELAVTSVPVAHAQLQWRGYTREVSPDGKLPLIYDYDYVDPAPLAQLSGNLTRYGNVQTLLTGDDDRFCVVGPGDEIRLEFDAKSLPPLKPGFERTYVLRTYGYCKDADPYTAVSDSVGPLPYRGMPDYPFGSDRERPRDKAYQEYLDTYQTRKASP
ncbi:cytochrome c biogenesis factor [bacterium]|nr:cytochrome c biogenesis factor [bacterium]